MKKNILLVTATLVALLTVFSACDSSNEENQISDNEMQEINEVELKDSQDDSQDNKEDGSVFNQTNDEEDKSTEENNDQSVNAEGSEEREDGETEQTTKVDKNEGVSSELKKNVLITSGEDAIQFLMQHLKEGEDKNVSFGASETTDTDDYGSYYTVQLIDIPMRASGKTGTLGFYKVYQDGTYREFYDNLSH